MYLIIQHDQDQFGLIQPATHKHVSDYRKALKEFERRTKMNERVTMLYDHEYKKLYALDGAEGQG